MTSTNNEETLSTSSKGHPTMKKVAVRAPVFTPYSRPRDSDITEEELAGLQISDEKLIGENSQHRALRHETGECNVYSVCGNCVSMKKIIKMMRKLPTRTNDIIECYYVCMGRVPTHQFINRMEQDQLTFDKQTVFMKAQFARGFEHHDKDKMTRQRSAKIRELMLPDKDDKHIKQERTQARDDKYESKFLAQGLGPIEHARGDCTDYWSMCDDCVSLHKCYTMGKRCPERTKAGYALFWRVMERVPTREAYYISGNQESWAKEATTAAVDQVLESYFAYTEELGSNYAAKGEILEMFRRRRQQLLEKHAPQKVNLPVRWATPPTSKEVESAFKAQVTINFNCTSVDKITDMLSKLITDNNVGVNPQEWGRRMASFVLMLMQLCAESSLLIKITAVAQFLTHFNLPGLATFRGYAQQLAQVFQAAIERIKRHTNGQDLHEGLINESDEDEYIGEGLWRAQGDFDEPTPEGLIAGTAKLFCAMAGMTEYDVKVNGKRITRLDQISRTIVSTERLVQFVSKLFKYAFETASIYLFNMHPDMRELRLVSEKIPLWMDAVTAFYNDEGLSRVTKNVDEARKVMRWLKEGDEYNTLLWKFKIMPKAYAIFKNVYNMCDRMYQAGAPYLSESAMRVSPFTILITGGPGLGKSVMQYFLITDIMKDAFTKRGLVYKPGEQVHVHTSGQKHWDGYKEQSVVVIDDIFQSMDPQETIEQCMDLCRMKNMVSWPVAKADLASKGNTYMTSELLVMTGNVAIPNDIKSCVRSYDAIRRRVDMLIEHTVIPEYRDASGRLDKQKVSSKFPTRYEDGLPISADITPIFRFNVRDNQGTLIMENGHYLDLVKLAISMKEWEKAHEEGVIRANYIRAGLNVHGIEKPFVAQMWRNLMNTRPRNADEEYAGDLMMEADVALIQQMMYPNANRVFPQEGMLTEEERLEIFATIAQEQPPHQTWTMRMKGVYERLKRDTKETSTRFMTALGGFVDNMREKMQSSLMFKIGAMVTMAISMLSLGWISYKLISGTETAATFVGETSGDEKTRQTKTRFAHKIAGETATRMLHGQRWVATETTPKSTTWVPEAKLKKGQKTITISELLWKDDGTELPHDVLGPVENGVMQAQACPDRNAYNLGVNRVTNNAVVANAWLGGRIVATLRAIFVYGRVLMIPNHFFYGLDKGNQDIEIINSHGLVQRFNTNECEERTPPEEMDVTFLRLPKRFQCYADIRSHFHSTETINKYALNEAMLWVIDGEDNGKIITLCNNIKKDTELQYAVSSHSAKDPDKDIHLVKSYVYRGLTLAGYCGAPLIWLNPSVQGGHILGIHVAGTNLRGLTTPITREFLYSFLSDWNDVSIRVPDLDPIDGTMTAQSKRAIGKTTGLSHYGRVAPQNQVRLPSATSIIPSPLMGVFEPVTGPALLTPTKQHNPLRTGILKQKVPLVTFRQDIVDDAVKHLQNAILSEASPYRNIDVKARIMTIKEALNGIPGDQWITPMNLHTSPGYPYVTANTSKNGKYDFVTGEGDERELTSIVQERYETRIEEAKQGIVSMTLFMDILKDERVKLEKIEAGKTRIFNVAPFDLNIAVRVYFQAFAAHIMHNHVYGECAVGLNPHSEEWGVMLNHMRQTGDMWIGGDYSNYDKQLSYQLLKAVLTIVDAFYDDEHQLIRECLFETMFSAFHIAERDVYRVPQGNPSGIVMTSIVNSLVNSLMMRIMYVELGGHLSTFDDNVRLKTYGDDNIATISKNVPWFNMIAISKKFAEHGIVYNQPNKTVMDKPFMNEDEITFLKRNFRKERGRVLAPLHMDSIREMVNWIRVSNDDEEATRMNFLAACREMYHHGKKEFEAFTTHVYAYAQKCALRLPYTDYQTSGEYWGAERADRVNLTPRETTHRGEHCFDHENEETVFTAQSARAPRKTKAVWPLLCDLLIIAAIMTSTSKQSEQTPTENTAAPTQNADNITTRTEITTFSDSSVVTLTSPQDVAPVPATPVDPYMKQSLTEFLSRVYYYSAEWSSAQPSGALLAQITFPNFLFSVPQIWDKLKNFTYFRAGVKIGIRMNGSKFHYGQVLVSYTPNFNNLLDLQPAYNNVFSASGCPSFTISPSENEVHEFVLPFALPYQYIPMYYATSVSANSNGDAAYQFGVVNIHVLNPLSNTLGPVTPVSYTIFANFVDVDVAGYTPVAYTIPVRQFKTQATLPATLIYEPPRPSVVPQPDPLPVFPGVAEEDPFLAQKASAEQKSKSERGVVGATLETVSTLSGALSFIPEIGVVAAGISTVAGIGAQVADYFGWTNPVSLRAIQPVVSQFTNITNTHGLIDCQNLALSAESTVSPSTELLGGNGSEMKMLYIAQTPTLLAAGITWSGSDATDVGLWETLVTPLAECRQAQNNRIFPTLLSWVSRACLMWRGSIRYHIQITCSQMHVGRLRISFIPLNTLTQLNSDEYASAISTIIDIQQQTTMSFTIPYLSHQPWMQTARPDTFVIKTPSPGYLRISVLNELNHPYQPIPAVFINVWTSAGPDFQLARPDDRWLRANWVTTTNDPEPPEGETPFVAQGLTREMIRTMPAPPLIPATGSREDRICNADEFHHVKDIIMRPTWIGSAISSGLGATCWYSRIDPFAAVTRYPTAIQPQIDYLTYFRLIFRFSRGGTRVVFAPMDQTNLQQYASMLIANDFIDADGTVGVVEAPRIQGYLTAAWPDMVNQHVPAGSVIAYSNMPTTAVIPYYSSLYGIPNAGWTGGTTLGSFQMYGIRPTCRFAYTSGKPEILLAAADDYELIFLVGPPALNLVGA